MDNLNLQASDDKTKNLATALAYADLGWQIFPCWQIDSEGKCACGTDCKSPGKHPISALAPRGQDSATNDKQVITQWWTEHPNANIAIYLAGSGLCAIDIDPRNGGDYTIEDLESQHGELVADVMQLTGGGGEHRLFLRPDGTLPGKLGSGVDVKLNGYIIAEPSNHISGGEYIWEASSCPLDGAVAGPLPDWIRSFSTLDKSVDTGVALHAGMSNEQYYDVIEALPFIDNDERDTWLTVGMALHATNDRRAYEMWCQWSASSPKYDQKDQYRVWRSFRHKGLTSVDLPTIFKLAQDAGWLNVKKGVAEEVPIKLPKHGHKSETPEHLLDIPVKPLSEIIHWMEGYSRQPQREISIVATLALASVLAGRNYCSEESNTSSMYFMLLADTGVGKNYAKTSIQTFLVQSGLDHLLSGSGNTSAGAVYTALCRAPCHIQIADEVGKQLQTARKQVNGQMAEAFSTLTEAYSATTSYMIPRNYSNMVELTKGKGTDEKKVVVHHPAITTLGLATSGQVFDNLSTAEIEDGFLNRLHVVEVSEPQAPRRRSKRLPVPEHLRDWAYNIRHPEPKSRTDLSGIEVGYDVTPTPTVVAIDDGATLIFDGFFNTLADLEDEGEFALPDLTRRWVENAMRLSTALAVCENADDPIISADIAGWCVEYVFFYGKRFMDTASTRVADGDFHRLYLNVQELVERSEGRGMTERDLSTYSRLFASSRPNEREQAFRALLAESRIMQVAIPSPSGRGRKRMAYISPKFFDETTMDAGK